METEIGSGDEIRSDSSTAQFPVIRTVLSMAVIHRFRLATLDISKLTSKPVTLKETSI